VTKYLNVDMKIWGLVSDYKKSVLTYEKTFDRGDECPVCTALAQTISVGSKANELTSVALSPMDV